MSEHPVSQRTSTVFAIVVTSDTRTEKENETGRKAVELIEAEGHKVKVHLIVPNDETRIKAEIQKTLHDPEIQVIVTSGGTGIGPKDKTISTVAPLLEKDMPGFGEIYRNLSYQEVGGPAIMSGARAGVALGKLVFCLPGSKNAVSLALSKLILPNIGHMLWELKRL